MNTNEFRADRSYSERLPKVPHGYYLSDRNTMDIRVDEPAASAVRTIFKLYIGGWGYKKIAEYMNELDSPAPGTANSDSLCKKAGRSTKWSISSIESILKMDFYVGTLRGTAGYAREQAGPVIADHHEPIVDYRTFMLVKSLLQKRSELHYRGQKKYEHLYSEFLFCGDCGAPMFAVSRRDLAPAYTCGTYHRCGTRFPIGKTAQPELCAEERLDPNPASGADDPGRFRGGRPEARAVQGGSRAFAGSDSGF